MIVHATSIARLIAREWRTALLLGPSGAGKSDLALRALGAGWRLVADDYTLVWPCAGRLWGRAPDSLPDFIEARGAGLLPVERLVFAPVELAVHCGPGPVERVPESGEHAVFEGVSVPVLHLNPLESSALAKLDRVLSTRALGG